MKKPFYLGIRSAVLFESALRDVNRDDLRAMLSDAVAGKDHAIDLRRQKLVVVELSRRKAADNLALVIVFIITVFSSLVPLLSS